MTRLQDRLERVLEHTPLRATAGRHRRTSSPRVTVARLIVPAPRPAPDDTMPARGGTMPAARATAGFTDCRGEWHAWEDAS